MAAPAFAASTAAFAICSGVFGKSGCLFAASPEPVTAQDTKTFSFIILNQQNRSKITDSNQLLFRFLYQYV
jgi:hypothetical protein